MRAYSASHAGVGVPPPLSNNAHGPLLLAPSAPTGSPSKFRKSSGRSSNFHSGPCLGLSRPTARTRNAGSRSQRSRWRWGQCPRPESRVRHRLHRQPKHKTGVGMLGTQRPAALAIVPCGPATVSSATSPFFMVMQPTSQPWDQKEGSRAPAPGQPVNRGSANAQLTRQRSTNR